ncbi:S1C family serine protease [Piscinibacter sp.]|jgi:serine protease Do|uniref:S1C family serine protease n=1 Tax=Piscinibacter sp. TaxID=1903157 RepID=UPI00355A3D3E
MSKLAWCKRLGIWAAALLSVTLCADGAIAATPTPPSQAELQAQAEALARASAAVVGVHAIAVEDAATIDVLGRERTGSGVVIDADGLVLTIGYLIVEAEHVDLVLAAEHVIPARVVAYDPASGFGLLQGLVPVQAPAARMGSSSSISPHEPLMIASGGEDGDLSLARMVSRRAFSGSWEYHIEGALFTTPARTDHSGAALFNASGELLGIGSLLVMDALGPNSAPLPGNMFVPVDLLKPILRELRERGASRSSARPWLGLNCMERDGVVRVLRTTRDSPAEAAGLLPGDHIVRIDGVAVSGLDGLYKTLWKGESPEREVRLDIVRGGEPQTITLRSRDRMTTLRRPQGI